MKKQNRWIGLILVFGFGFWLQKLSFFPGSDSLEKSFLLNPGQENTSATSSGARKGNDPQLSWTTPTSGNLANPPTSGFSLAPRPTRLFPKKALIPKGYQNEMAHQLLGLLVNEIEWPEKLSTQHIYPRWKMREGTNHKQELFVDYEIKVQGFTVPQSYLRVLMFPSGENHYRVGLIDYYFQLPPQSHFSVRVAKTEAIERAKLSEPKMPKNSQARGIWKTQGVWHITDGEWVPSWKIQFQGSPQTIFIDVRDGNTTTERSALSLTDLARSQRRIQFQVRGFGTPELESAAKSSLFPLTNLTLPLQQSNEKTPRFKSDEMAILSTDWSLQKLKSEVEVFDLRNQFVVVTDPSAIRPLSVHWSLPPPNSTGPGEILLNPKNQPRETAIINAYVYINKARDFLVNIVGFDAAPMNNLIQTFVNRDNDLCNAQYLNGTLEFYEETEECRNTSYDTIIYHEYTHFVDDIIGGITDTALAEGMADVMATFISNQPLIGQEIYKDNLIPLRTADNNSRQVPTTKPFTPTSSSSDTQEQSPVYTNAEAWSGFAWRARRGLIEKYGPIEGRQWAQWLFLSPLETNAPNIDSAVAEVFARAARDLPLDQSPDYALLRSAAAVHGLSTPRE